MTDFIALIHKDDGSDFGVSFPDFPGCVSAGRNLDEARKMAEEALAMHIEAMLESGKNLPLPSDFADVMREANNRQAIAFVISVRPPSKTVRINVSILEKDLREIDDYAERHGLTRSGLLVKAARLAIDNDSF